MTLRTMWNQPYLETCCRSALHRLSLSGTIGRPADHKDGPCLARLTTMGLAQFRAESRYVITPAGIERHNQEILRRVPD
jgi:DNA-binding transcriptional regulator PaaX